MYKGNLTKKEALELLKQGKKVCREGFSSKEYIYMDGNTLKFEDGVYVMEWWRKIEPTFSQPEDGKAWYLYKEDKHDN